MLRFTIRDVLWLTVVVALCCAWWLHHHYADARLRSQQDFLFNKAESLQRKATMWET
jgi:hypothetical protein